MFKRINTKNENVIAQKEVMPHLKKFTNYCTILNNEIISNKEDLGIYQNYVSMDIWQIFRKRKCNNVLLVGNPEISKMSVVRNIAKSIVRKECLLIFNDYFVISIDVYNLVTDNKYNDDIEEILNIFRDFLKTKENVILFFDNFYKMIVSDQLDYYYNFLKSLLLIPNVYIIASVSTAEFQEEFMNEKIIDRNFSIVEVKSPKIREVKHIVKYKIKELEEHHDITISDEILDYLIINVCSMQGGEYSMEDVIDTCDMAMVNAIDYERNSVKKEDVNSVFKFNYDLYNTMEEKEKKITAYHEIGHYFMNEYSYLKKYRNIAVVSVIPITNGILGANVIEDEDIFCPSNKEFYDSYIDCLLAGKVAQKLVSAEDDDGCEEDMANARMICKEMILRYGMVNNRNFKNISYYDNIKNEYENMSQVMLEEYEKCLIDYIEARYNRVKNLLNRNIERIAKMAEYLMENGIVSGYELKQLFFKEDM